jgi:tetratricopeptide (TPR) repeat protein
LLQFGVDRFFFYNQRTDNCANCKIGDLTGEMVCDLAEMYVSRGEPEAAVRIVERLVNERGQDVSAYNLALTFEAKSRAYWMMKDFESAKAAIQEGLRRFPEGWQADRLRKTLEQYEKEIAKPSANE